jgi:hypothetical protein
MKTKPKQQLLFESVEDAVIESLYTTDDGEKQDTEFEQSCLECDSMLEISYDNKNNPRYFCDNCGCFVKGITALSVADMNITQATEA